MIENIFKKLHIKIKPDRLMTYIFYSICACLALFAIGRLLGFFVGDARIDAEASPYLYSIGILIPVLAFSFYVNSGIPKCDDDKVKIYIVTCSLLGLILGSMLSTMLNKACWEVLESIPNYRTVFKLYPELFAPAVKTLCFVVPFVTIFKIVDYFLFVIRDEDMSKSIAGFCGITLAKRAKETGAFSCETVICTAKGSSIPVIVPETKRFEATLVQGATGTGKTAAVLLPMSALDLEKKFFFREYSKKIGYSLLKRGIAYMNGPYDNEHINRNFSLSYIHPKKGQEEEFYNEVKPMILYQDNATGEVFYRNLGITIVENDGNFISKIVGVANNFDIDIRSIDPSAPETTLSMNPFAIPDPAKVASIIADVLNAMYESTGGGKAGDPFFTQVTMDAFQNLSILLKEMYPLLHDGEMASLEDMLELLYNFDAVEEMTEEMKKVPALEQKYKILIRYFEKNFYKPSLNINGFEIPGTRGSGRKDTEKFLYGAITQLNNLVRNPGLKAALCGKKNILDFDEALRTGSIITACSRKGDLGIIQAKAFGMFFILQFQDAVLRRKGNEDSRIPNFLYIDEFPEYITKDMEVMFTLFRKYRCGVTVAIQNLSQLEKSGQDYYRQTVLANTKTQIVFGDTVPADSAYWSEAFGQEKKFEVASSFKFEDGDLKKHISANMADKVRIKTFKLAELGFGSIYYKTKNAKGSSIFGEGKVSFLNEKYFKKWDVVMYNFEKYMMTKPDNPTITFNDKDGEDDDTLFGVNVHSRISSHMKNNANDSVVSTKPSSSEDSSESNVNVIANSPIPEDFEIIFEDEELVLEDANRDGGAITEDYETPVIKQND